MSVARPAQPRSVEAYEPCQAHHSRRGARRSGRAAQRVFCWAVWPRGQRRVGPVENTEEPSHVEQLFEMPSEEKAFGGTMEKGHQVLLAVTGERAMSEQSKMDFGARKVEPVRAEGQDGPDSRLVREPVSGGESIRSTAAYAKGGIDEAIRGFKPHIWNDGYRAGFNNGCSEGRNSGFNEAFEKGRTEGYAAGVKDANEMLELAEEENAEADLEEEEEEEEEEYQRQLQPTDPEAQEAHEEINRWYAKVLNTLTTIADARSDCDHLISPGVRTESEAAIPAGISTALGALLEACDRIVEALEVANDLCKGRQSCRGRSEEDVAGRKEREDKTSGGGYRDERQQSLPGFDDEGGVEFVNCGHFPYMAIELGYCPARKEDPCPQGCEGCPQRNA